MRWLEYGMDARRPAANDEMAGGRGADREGLPASAPSARLKAVSGTILVRRRPNTPLLEEGKSFTISGDMIKSSKRPAMVVGRNPYGKCRSRR